MCSPASFDFFTIDGSSAEAAVGKVPNFIRVSPLCACARTSCSARWDRVRIRWARSSMICPAVVSVDPRVERSTRGAAEPVEVAQVVVDRRLTPPQLLGRAGDRARLGHGGQSLQLTKIEHAPILRRPNTALHIVY